MSLFLLLEFFRLKKVQRIKQAAEICRNEEKTSTSQNLSERRTSSTLSIKSSDIEAIRLRKYSISYNLIREMSRSGFQTIPVSQKQAYLSSHQYEDLEEMKDEDEFEDEEEEENRSEEEDEDEVLQFEDQKEDFKKMRVRHNGKEKNGIKEKDETESEIELKVRHTHVTFSEMFSVLSSEQSYSSVDDSVDLQRISNSDDNISSKFDTPEITDVYTPRTYLATDEASTSHYDEITEGKKSSSEDEEGTSLTSEMDEKFVESRVIADKGIGFASGVKMSLLPSLQQVGKYVPEFEVISDVRHQRESGISEYEGISPTTGIVPLLAQQAARPGTSQESDYIPEFLSVHKLDQTEGSISEDKDFIPNMGLISPSEEKEAKIDIPREIKQVPDIVLVSDIDKKGVISEFKTTVPESGMIPVSKEGLAKSGPPQDRDYIHVSEYKFELTKKPDEGSDSEKVPKLFVPKDRLKSTPSPSASVKPFQYKTELTIDISPLPTDTTVSTSQGVLEEMSVADEDHIPKDAKRESKDQIDKQKIKAGTKQGYTCIPALKEYVTGLTMQDGRLTKESDTLQQVSLRDHDASKEVEASISKANINKRSLPIPFDSIEDTIGSAPPETQPKPTSLWDTLFSKQQKK